LADSFLLLFFIDDNGMADCENGNKPDAVARMVGFRVGISAG